MEFRKMVAITLHAKQKKRHRCTEQTFGLCGRRQGWDVLREQQKSFKTIYISKGQKENLQLQLFSYTCTEKREA